MRSFGPIQNHTHIRCVFVEKHRHILHIRQILQLFYSLCPYTTINDKNLFLILYFIRCCTLCTLGDTVMLYSFTTKRERGIFCCCFWFGFRYTRSTRSLMTCSISCVGSSNNAQQCIACLFVWLFSCLFSFGWVFFFFLH